MHVRERYQKWGWEKGISNEYIEKKSCYKCNQREASIVMIKTKEWSLGERLKWASLPHIAESVWYINHDQFWHASAFNVYALLY